MNADLPEELSMPVLPPVTLRLERQASTRNSMDALDQLSCAVHHDTEWYSHLLE